METQLKTQGLITLGCTLVLNMVNPTQLCGIIMCVGTFYPYFWAYLQQFDAGIKYSQVYMMQPILLTANWLGMCKA